MAHPGHLQDRAFTVPRLCQCEECIEMRVEPPPVTEEMRAKWRAMGLEVTKTPQKKTREDYYGASLDRYGR